MKNDKEIAIKALLQERQGYLHRNLLDRVAAVDNCLKELGHVPDRSFAPEAETATIVPTSERAVLRKAPPKKRT